MSFQTTYFPVCYPPIPQPLHKCQRSAAHRVFVGEVVEGRADGGLKLLFAHFVLVLEALFGSHLLEAKKVYFAMFSIAVLSKEIRSSAVPSR